VFVIAENPVRARRVLALEILTARRIMAGHPMYEHSKRPLLPRAVYLKRLALHFALASAIIGFSLCIGILGYRHFDKLPWLDAFENAAMILSGMGPMTQSEPDAGKIFAGCYALFSGLAFITSMGVVFAPVVHRFLHKFHLEN
jgi:hypothetical protein